ncbi:MAG: response regulator [Pseudanabaena sp.]
MSSPAAQKSLELSALIDLDVPKRIISDSTCLRQILVNLIGNGIKFTENGEIAITVSSTLIEPSSSTYQLNFAVRDTGVGIDADSIQRLFKPFSQADSSITRQYGGTGLGLAISKQLCKLMGGDIQVESIVGEGTTFRFFIHVQAIAVENLAINLELNQKKVLIVNSNTTIQQVIRTYTQSWDMIAESAISEEEALQYLSSSKYDAILIDRCLQSSDQLIDGLDLARNIKELFPPFPIILLNSVADIDFPSSISFAGYLTKPITGSKLYQVFSNLFSPETSQETNQINIFQLNSNFASRYPFQILIVEDNSVNQQILLLMLERLGYKGDAVANGLEAVNALERQSYDLVFMDIQMPIMDGLTACQHIRRMPERNPWVIGLSANAFRESRDTAISAGMNDYLTKPLQIEALITILQRISENLQLNKPQSEANIHDLPNQNLVTLTEPLLETTKATFSDVEQSISISSSKLQLDLSIADLAVINASTLNMLEKCISKKDLGEIISSYLIESKEAIAKMREALSQLDFATISFENHSFKGGCGTLGADRLVAICKELSNLCKSNSHPHKVKTIDMVLQRLELEFDKVSQLLQQKASS